MAKAYWVVCYRSIKNPDALAAYAKLAAPAIQSKGPPISRPKSIGETSHWHRGLPRCLLVVPQIATAILRLA